MLKAANKELGLSKGKVKSLEGQLKNANEKYDTFKSEIENNSNCLNLKISVDQAINDGNYSPLIAAIDTLLSLPRIDSFTFSKFVATDNIAPFLQKRSMSSALLLINFIPSSRLITSAKQAATYSPTLWPIRYDGLSPKPNQS